MNDEKNLMSFVRASNIMESGINVGIARDCWGDKNCKIKFNAETWDYEMFFEDGSYVKYVLIADELAAIDWYIC